MSLSQSRVHCGQQYDTNSEHLPVSFRSQKNAIPLFFSYLQSSPALYSLDFGKAQCLFKVLAKYILLKCYIGFITYAASKKNTWSFQHQCILEFIYTGILYCIVRFYIHLFEMYPMCRCITFKMACLLGLLNDTENQSNIQKISLINSMCRWIKFFWKIALLHLKLILFISSGIFLMEIY